MDAILDVAGRKGLPVIETWPRRAEGVWRKARQPRENQHFSFDYYKVTPAAEGFVATDDD